MRMVIGLVVLLLLTAGGIYLTAPSAAETNRTVAYVNQAAIDEREFKLFMNQQMANVSDYFKQQYNADDSPAFWSTSFNGEIPEEKVKQAALKQIANIKVQQLMAKQHGLLDDLSYQVFLDKLSEENKRRAAALKTKQVIYGPQQYDEPVYYHYLFSNMVIQLKSVLSEKEWPLSEQELKNSYDKLKENRFKKADDIKLLKIVLPYVSVQGNKKAAAKAKMDEIKERLNQGESFEEISQSLLKDKAWSWDIGEHLFSGANQKEDTEGSLSVLLSEAGKLSAGQVGGVFEMDGTSYGIIKIIERKDNGFAEFNEVIDNVRQLITDEKYAEKVERSIESAKVDIVDSVYRSIKIR